MPVRSVPRGAVGVRGAAVLVGLAQICNVAGFLPATVVVCCAEISDHVSGIVHRFSCPLDRPSSGSSATGFVAGALFAS